MTSATASKPVYDSIIQLKIMAINMGLKPPFDAKMPRDTYRQLMEELPTTILDGILIRTELHMFRKPPILEGVALKILKETDNPPTNMIAYFNATGVYLTPGVVNEHNP